MDWVACALVKWRHSVLGLVFLPINFVQVNLIFHGTVSMLRMAKSEQQRMYEQCEVYFLMLVFLICFALYHYNILTFCNFHHLGFT